MPWRHYCKQMNKGRNVFGGEPIVFSPCGIAATMKRSAECYHCRLLFWVSLTHVFVCMRLWANLRPVFILVHTVLRICRSGKYWRVFVRSSYPFTWKIVTTKFCGSFKLGQFVQVYILDPNSQYVALKSQLALVKKRENRYIVDVFKTTYECFDWLPERHKSVLFPIA